MSSELFKQLEGAAQRFAQDAGEGRKRGCSAFILAREHNKGLAVVAGELHEMILMMVRVMEEDRGLRGVVLSAAFTYLSNQSDEAASKLIRIFKELVDNKLQSTGFANDVLKKIFQDSDDNENNIS